MSSTTTAGGSPPIFAGGDKFDRIGWGSRSGLTQGVAGYLDCAIKNSTAANVTNPAQPINNTTTSPQPHRALCRPPKHRQFQSLFLPTMRIGIPFTYRLQSR
ncbi:hypothetical protein NP233_g1721 [Leucocoprinus birnbaumii]|uniref:Uncharacterized protein n=1 Tax=Leucocoprinus birnbaumii TaxID=56174 RepID=A0AAD5W5B1_9AGAR|nr:hypothetical protein NP233_g1721 [Leucocoprinus birnbaumii]